MPVIQNDWLTIKAKFGDKTALYALTTAQASLLLSIAPQLEWRKTYRAFGYDFADWDYLQAEVADLQRGLTMPVYITDLMSKLDELTDAVFSLYCCPDGTPLDLTDGDQYTDQYTEEEANGVPDNIVDAGYADDDDDWDGFYNYKCMVSHVAVESLAQKLDKFEQLSDAATIGILSTGAIIVVLGTILGVVTGGTFVIVLAILGGLAAVADMYQELAEASEGFFSDAADEVRANAEALACAMFLGDGPSDSYDRLLTKADDVLTAPTAAVIRLMNMKADVKALYSGRYDTTDVAARLAELGYLVSGYDCDACDEEPPPSPYQLLHPPWEDFSVGTVPGASDDGSTYDEETGIVELIFDNVSATDMQFHAHWDTLSGVWAHKAMRHGFKVQFIDESRPVGSNIYNILEPPQTPHFPSVEQPLGSTWGGYNNTQHSGEFWTAWADQFDVTEVYSDGQTLSNFGFHTGVTSKPNEFGTYSIKYKIWIVTAYTP